MTDEATEKVDEVPQTERERLYELHREVFKDALSTLKRKNSDYSPGDDPYGNLRRHGIFGICVRLEDKIARLETYAKRGSFEVAEEDIRELIRDMVNYPILALGLATEKKK